MDRPFDGWPHVICSQQFSRSWLEDQLFPEARSMKLVVGQGGCDILKGVRAVSFFYQKSTRTAASFAMATDFLGGKVVYSTENAREFSGASVGEILPDTILVLNRFRPDVIFLRYDQEIGAEIAAGVSSVPIINAGDRHPADRPQSPYSGQHPTQAFLDLFTIQERFGRIDGIKIAVVGDLKNGRTVRSLAYLLGKFKGVEIYFVSPETARMRDDVTEYLNRHNVRFKELRDLRQIAPLVDVVYQTRTQNECGTQFDRNDHELGYFIVDLGVVNSMKKHSIVMHPLPRVDEITPDVDSDERAVYLTDQVDSGLFTRMALLKIILAPPRRRWFMRPLGPSFFSRRRPLLNRPVNLGQIKEVDQT